MGAVSRALTQLMRNLRCKSRVDLAHFADPSRLDRLDLDDEPAGDVSILAVDVRPIERTMAKLSAAEREIAVFVLRGWSNERIARARQTSARTIANQLQALYRKLDVSSRNELRATLSAKS